MKGWMEGWRDGEMVIVTQCPFTLSDEEPEPEPEPEAEPEIDPPSPSRWECLLAWLKALVPDVSPFGERASYDLEKKDPKLTSQFLAE